jgi:nicotinamidase-related amidase
MKTKTALLIIDMQNDFCKPNAPLFVPNNPKIIPRIKKEIEKARKESIPVIYTQDWHKPDDKEFKIWPKHCVAGTEGAKIVKELAPQKGDLVIKKPSYSAFYRTKLEEKLKKLKINKLILTGCVSNVCILFTCFDAYLRGYEIVVKKDCLGYVNKKYHEFALNLMEKVFEAKLE